MNAILTSPGEDLDPPLTEEEAKLLGDAYARLTSLLPAERDADENIELGRAVYAGAANARRVLRRFGYARLRDWLTRLVAELRATGFFEDAAVLRQLAVAMRRWESGVPERRSKLR